MAKQKAPKLQWKLGPGTFHYNGTRFKIESGMAPQKLQALLRKLKDEGCLEVYEELPETDPKPEAGNNGGEPHQ
jgi:hypothetical protein